MLQIQVCRLKHGTLPILRAAATQDVTLIQSMLGQEPISVLNAVDKMGRTVLHAMLESKMGVNLDCLKFLLNYQVNGEYALSTATVNARKCINGKAPLHYATDRHLSAFFPLVELRKDLDINIQDIERNSPLHYAIKTLSLHRGLQNGSDLDHPLKVISSLLDQGAQPFLDNMRSERPIDWARTKLAHSPMYKDQVVRDCIKAGHKLFPLSQPLVASAA